MFPLQLSFNKLNKISFANEFNHSDSNTLYIISVQKTMDMEMQSSDIIKQLQQEIELLNKERKLDLIKNKVVDMACIVSMTDKKGYITYVNDLFCSVAGYKREELIGQNHNIVRHPNMPKAAFKEVWSTIGSGKVWRGDVENKCKDGSSYFVDALISPIIGEDGKPEGYIGIRYEKTAQVLALQEAQALQEAVDTGWASMEFKPDGSIQKVNSNFINALDYSNEKELMGEHHSTLCDPAYSKSIYYSLFWENLNSGEAQAGEFKFIKKNGEEIWFNATYSPIKNKQGEVIKVISIATEISEMKKVLQGINNLVSKVSEEGDLSLRLDTSKAKGDYKLLGDKVNDLLKNVGEPVLVVKNLMSDLAQGDLSQEFNLKTKGDFKELGDAYNNALLNLNNLMANIKDIAHLVASSSEELLTKSDQMQGTTQEVASAIQQMAEGAHQQAQQTDEASKLVEEVLRSANEMGTQSDSIKKAAETGQSSAKDGLTTVQKVVENMGDIQASADVTSKSIDVLTERSEEIARTLNVITDIAAQTNLLALNAAIEAARAGEAGRGFAVVAEEIRKLAEDSRKSAVDIQKVISAVQKDVNQAGKAIDEMKSSVKSGTQASQAAEKVFEVIGASTNDTFSLSDQIQKATGIQKEAINETVKNIEKIVVVSEESAAGAEQIATSSKDLSDGMDEVNATSKQLASAANQLNDGVSKFILKTEGKLVFAG
jgi:methyl-accepting chemotaxis protein